MTRQLSCRHCGQDIENSWPYRRGEWRDRGNNTHCPTPQGDAGQHHQPHRTLPARTIRLANEHTRNASDTFRRDIKVVQLCRDVIEAWNEGASPSHFYWLVAKLKVAAEEARVVPVDIVDTFKSQPKKDRK